ncbi:MAG: hypothetical protein ABI647_18260 [Gemmatimonadota bacterium]
MSWLLSAIGATLFGAIGWWLGALAGTMTAYIVSTIASGIGLYYGRRLALTYWPK